MLVIRIKDEERDLKKKKELVVTYQKSRSNGLEQGSAAFFCKRQPIHGLDAAGRPVTQLLT